MNNNPCVNNNFFIILFIVFSFQQNKQYPNAYLMLSLILCQLCPLNSEGKLVYISPHKRNPREEINSNLARFDNGKRLMVEAHKSKPVFMSHPRKMVGSNFVPTYHHCGVISHIRPHCSLLRQKQNHVARLIPRGHPRKHAKRGVSRIVDIPSIAYQGQLMKKI